MSEQPDKFINTEVGGCKILERLSPGGMGFVYRAHHIGLDKTVCVKILPPAPEKDERHVQFFLREAQSTAKLEHPNIVQIHHVGMDRGVHFIIMSFIHGKSLADMVALKGALPVAQATGIITGILKGLSAAHSNSIIHRDIKPSNILVTEAGVPKIVDFGLARKLKEEKHLTITGEMVGTAYFMAPEQGLGNPVDHRADLYATGATYFYILTSRYPFDGKTFMDVIRKHISEPLPSLMRIRPDIPLWSEQVIGKLMRKNPQDRFQSAQEVLDALSSHEHNGSMQTVAGTEQVFDIPSISARLKANLREAGNSASADLSGTDSPSPKAKGNSASADFRQRRTSLRLVSGTAPTPTSAEGGPSPETKDSSAQGAGRESAVKPPAMPVFATAASGTALRRCLSSAVHFSLTLAAGMVFLLAGSMHGISGSASAAVISLLALGLGFLVWILSMQSVRRQSRFERSFAEDLEEGQTGFAVTGILLSPGFALLFYLAGVSGLGGTDALGRACIIMTQMIAHLFSRDNTLVYAGFAYIISAGLLGSYTRSGWNRWAGSLLTAVTLAMVWKFGHLAAAGHSGNIMLLEAAIFLALAGITFGFVQNVSTSIGFHVFVLAAVILTYAFAVSPHVDFLAKKAIRIQEQALLEQGNMSRYDTDGLPISTLIEDAIAPPAGTRKRAWKESMLKPVKRFYANAGKEGRLLLAGLLILIWVNASFLMHKRN